MREIARRLEKGGVLSYPGISVAAQPFLAALLHVIFPRRPIVMVTKGLQAQESVQQDLETWLGLQSEVHTPKSEHGRELPVAPCNFHAAVDREQPLFYPA